MPPDDPTPALRPPRSRRARAFAGGAAVALGAFAGLGTFTFGYGDGAAYLRNDPVACTACHVMQEQFDAWSASSHHGVATCNDCHLRHDFVGKWWTKVDNGFFHSLAFTTGDFPDPIRIKPRNREVVQAACLHCHAEFVDAALPAHAGEDALDCLHCHLDVGHAQR